MSAILRQWLHNLFRAAARLLSVFGTGSDLTLCACRNPNAVKSPACVCVIVLKVLRVTSAFCAPTSQFEFHSAVVDECRVNTVAKGFESGDAEHSGLLLPEVLVGSPPEGVLGKDTGRD